MPQVLVPIRGEYISSISSNKEFVCQTTPSFPSQIDVPSPPRLQKLFSRAFDPDAMLPGYSHHNAK